MGKTDDPQDFNQKVISAVRETGKAPHTQSDLLILHTVGAKSGQERVNPMAYRKSEDGNEVFVFASNEGGEKSSGWYHNAIAHPDRVQVEIYGVPKFRAKVRELVGSERDAVYEKQAAQFEKFREYEQKTTRVIPVLGLSPVDPDIKL